MKLSKKELIGFLILLLSLPVAVFLVSQKQEVREKAETTPINSVNNTSYTIPILVIQYFPTSDGVNLNPNTTGINDTLANIRQKTAQLTQSGLQTLKEASRFRGYQNQNALPSLEFSLLDTKEFLTAIPPSNNEIPWKRGQGVYRPDYRKILTDLNICDYVENKGVKQVWMWGYHYGNIEPVESNMAGPHGDISNSERIDDMPKCSKTYTLFNYNYGRALGEMMEDHGHQIEAVLNFVDGDLFWNKFVGPYGNQAGNKRCGWTHFAPNGQSDYDWQNQTSVMSDCEDWQPESGNRKTINCHNWHGVVCQDDGGVNFKRWWMQNLPGRGNFLTYQGKYLRNWWDFIGDFDQAMVSGKSLLTQTSPLVGDIDNDGDIDIFDYNMVVSHFGPRIPTGGSPADLDKDNDVDIFDYNLLVSNFGKKI